MVCGKNNLAVAKCMVAAVSTKFKQILAARALRHARGSRDFAIRMAESGGAQPPILM
jgi:hypothetical protein